MKKLVAFSFVSALVFAISAGLYYYFNISTTPTSTKAAVQNQDIFQKVTATETSNNIQHSNELKLTVAAPKASITYINEPSIKLAGATKKNSVLSIIGGKNAILRAVDSDGSFAPDIPLNDGVNSLTITVFDQNGSQTAINKTVLYLKDLLPNDFVIHTGKLSYDEEKTAYLTKDDATTDFKTTKQTKIYLFEKSTKKLLKSIDKLTSNLETFVVLDNNEDQNALLILQDIDTNLTSENFYGKIDDKSVNEEIFTVKATSLEKDKAINMDITITEDTIIKKAGDTETKLRGSDIKLADKILLVKNANDEKVTSQEILIIPGQAAGVLKDVKN